MRDRKVNVARPVGIGGGAEAEHKVLQILYGQTVAGVNCIKSTVSDPPSSIPISGNTFATSFTPNGLGSAYLWVNGLRSDVPVYVWNNNPIYPHLLMSGSTISTFQTISVSGSPAPSGGPVYFDLYIPYGA